MASALSMGGCQPAASRPVKVTKTTEDWFAPISVVGHSRALRPLRAFIAGIHQEFGGSCKLPYAGYQLWSYAVSQSAASRAIWQIARSATKVGRMFEPPVYDPELAAILPALDGFVPVAMTPR